MQQDGTEGEWYSTLRSGLRSLSVSNVDCGDEGFLFGLGGNSYRLELKALKLSNLDCTDCKDLAKSVRELSSVEELELQDEQQDTLYPAHSVQPAKQFQFLVRKSGERRISIAFAMRILVHYYRPLRPWNSQNGTAKTGSADDRSSKERVSKHLYPMRLQVAKQKANCHHT
jgi:hypothetical protein